MRRVFSAAGTFDATLVPAVLGADLGAGVPAAGALGAAESAGAAGAVGGAAAAGLTAVLVGCMDPLQARVVSGIPYLSMRPAPVNWQPSTAIIVWDSGQARGASGAGAFCP
jgi:hypothetical protein